MNLTPLALAAAYAYLNKGDKEQAPPVAPAATPAVTPAAQIPPRTDMTQMFGATQDAEDMAAGPMGGQAPSVMTKKNPSFKQAFSEARLAGDKTFQWNGKPYTTELADKTTPIQKTTNNPGAVQKFIAGQSAPDQSDAETKRLKAQNTKALDYNAKNYIGTDIDSDLYDRGLPKDKNNKIDIDQFINNVKTQDQKESLKRTPSQYDEIRKIVLKNHPNNYIENSKLKAEPVKKTYRDSDGKIHSYEEKPKETSSTRNPKTGRPYAKGGKVKAYAKGGTVSASKRGDGIAQRGHTKGRLV